MKISYRNLGDPKQFLKLILFPLTILGLLLSLIPYIFTLVEIPVVFNPFLFVLLGAVPIVLGFLYPYIHWKNKEVNINEKMHFFITYIRVLAISNLELRDIFSKLSKKEVYGDLAEEIRKIRVLSTQWKMTLEKSLRFIANRTPSNILRDFLDRFSQSIASGVKHREFIEGEQEGVMEEYKTMYESSNDIITVLNELYIALITAIAFLMVFGIILPMVSGFNINTYVYATSFVLIVAESTLYYFVYSFIPKDNIWYTRRRSRKSNTEKKIDQALKGSVAAVCIIGVFLFLLPRYVQALSFLQVIPFEILFAFSITPLAFVGIMVFLEEERISRREKNFIGFLPSLGSIAAMRGGKITEPVGYLGNKDYGVLTKNIRDLHKRLKTNIDDASSWDWFAVETGSNLIQRFSEMFREATEAAADPRSVSRMIVGNMRQVKDLRFKKFTLLRTTNGLFYGITAGAALTLYVALVIARYMEGMAAGLGTGFTQMERLGELGQLLPIGTAGFSPFLFVIIFLVLVVHCFIMALTLRILKGGHILTTLVHFVLMVWIVAALSVGVNVGLSSFFSF